MKYKANYFNDIIIMLTIIIVGLYLGAFIPLLIFDKENLLKISKFTGLALLVVVITFNILNVLLSIFLKPQIELNQYDFVVKNKIYRYSEIKFISFELTEFSRDNGASFVLYLYRNNKDKITISYPSILLCMKLKKKCTEAGFRSNYRSKILGLLLLPMGVAFVSALVSYLT